MRNIIIGLSILFFALSGIITYKALMIPVNNTHYQNNPKESRSEDIPPQSEKFAKDPETNQALVKELQATIARLEDKLSDKNGETKTNVESEGSVKKSRVLAVLDGRTFRSGQIVIDKYLMKVVDELVRGILASPGHLVMIEGHTDSIPIKSSPEREYIDNMELSFLRAKAVADILVKKGISLERISVIGYGDTRPVASNETEDGRAKNRRVEVKLIPKSKKL